MFELLSFVYIYGMNSSTVGMQIYWANHSEFCTVHTEYVKEKLGVENL